MRFAKISQKSQGNVDIKWHGGLQGSKHNQIKGIPRKKLNYIAHSA